jgi:hypothetical protein
MVRINDNTGWVHVASDAHPQIAPPVNCRLPSLATLPVLPTARTRPWLWGFTAPLLKP